MSCLLFGFSGERSEILSWGLAGGEETSAIRWSAVTILGESRPPVMSGNGCIPGLGKTVRLPASIGFAAVNGPDFVSGERGLLPQSCSLGMKSSEGIRYNQSNHHPEKEPLLGPLYPRLPPFTRPPRALAIVSA